MAPTPRDVVHEFRKRMRRNDALDRLGQVQHIVEVEAVDCGEAVEEMFEEEYYIDIEGEMTEEERERLAASYLNALNVVEEINCDANHYIQVLTADLVDITERRTDRRDLQLFVYSFILIISGACRGCVV